MYEYRIVDIHISSVKISISRLAAEGWRLMPMITESNLKDCNVYYFEREIVND